MSRRVAAVVSAVLSIALLTGAAPPRGADGGGERGQPDMQAMMERNKRCLREVAAHTSKVSFDRKDLETFLAEWRSFDQLDVAEPQDDADGEDVSAMSCFDLSAALADRRYVAWARERRLDPKTWVLKSMRIVMTHARWRAPAEQAEMRKQMEAQRRDLERRCGSMGPNACRDIQQAFAGSETAMAEMAAMWKLFPEPSTAEAALLAQYDPRIRRVMEDEGHGRKRGGVDGAPGDAPPEDEDAPPEDDEE